MLKFVPSTNQRLHPKGEMWGVRVAIRQVAGRSLVGVDLEQPPDEKERNEGQQDVAEPLAGCCRSAEVEHWAMVVRMAGRCCAIGNRLGLGAWSS